jgi:Golgi phosphoprotein 3 GPP34
MPSPCPAAQTAVIDRLQAAAADGQPLDPRTAGLLCMTGPARLLEVVAPERGRARRHARDRIDGALDRADLKAIGKVVRRLIAEAEAAAAAGATVATMGAVAGGS